MYNINRVVRVLVNYDSSIVNDEDESSNSPLHIAAIKGHIHVISALLEYGAAVDARLVYYIGIYN